MMVERWVVVIEIQSKTLMATLTSDIDMSRGTFAHSSKEQKGGSRITTKMTFKNPRREYGVRGGVKEGGGKEIC